jgi:uncharacterized membrane protein
MSKASKLAHTHTKKKQNKKKQRKENMNGVNVRKNIAEKSEQSNELANPRANVIIIAETLANIDIATTNASCETRAELDDINLKLTSNNTVRN